MNTYKVYLRGGAVAEFVKNLVFVETDTRIFFCESEESRDSLIANDYAVNVGNIVAYFEKSDIIGMEYPPVPAPIIKSERKNPPRNHRGSIYENF